MMSRIDELNELFALDDCLCFETHSSGLILAKVNTPDCYGEFFLQGAHVVSYQPRDRSESILFLSQQAVFEHGKPIRGGIPICFPWFGSHEVNPALPAHGWARTQEWQIIETARSMNHVTVRLMLSQDGFQAICELVFGSDLSIDVAVSNTLDVPLSFEIALHTYIAIGSVDEVEIDGLENITYLDQLTNKMHVGDIGPIRFQEETDRIYQGSTNRITIRDRNQNNGVEIVPKGSRSTVVWNPWIDKSHRMADFGDEEYRQMCCVETANVRTNRINLKSGQTHATGVVIRAI